MAFISVTSKELRIMKKIYSIVFAAVALFSAASCQEELVNNETPSAQGENFTITAVADAQTKTALTDEGLNSVWTPGDAIAVIDYAGQGAEFTTAITENAASAKFACEDFYVGSLTDISVLPIVALYPYQEGLTCSILSQLNPTGDNTIRGIVFPHEQTAVAGSFDKTAAFTWAMATGATKDNLVFNNLYSLLKVKVTEENITEIKISATSGSLAGNVTLPMTQSGATLTVVDGEGKSEVTLTCEDGFDTEKYYYICVLPGTYEGFSIALNGYTVKTKSSAATFDAATVYDLGEVVKPIPTTTVVYLKPLNSWLLDDARFAAYTWVDGGSADWFDMTDTNEDGVFEVEVPTAADGLIFCRMNPAFDENGWNAGDEADDASKKVWGQTGNLVIPSDGNIAYILYDTEWSTLDYAVAFEEPEELLMLYLKPNSNWEMDNARFAAYFFGNGETWVSMTDSDSDGIYEVEAPAGYPNVIFCRMNPSAAANNWNNKWNQSNDLTVPKDGTNLYTVADGTWDKGGGTWSTK